MGFLAMMSSIPATSFDDRAPATYELIAIPSDRVDEEMRVAGASSGIPGVLQGLWWMDGNPLPDEVISLGASPWNPAERTTWIWVYGERIWSWHGNVRGRLLYCMARMTRLVYEIRFDRDLMHGTITPNVGILGFRARIPRALIRFTMHRVSEDVWLRKSRFFGAISHVYHLRRIVRGDGTRLDAYAAYVASAPARSFLAVRREEPVAVAREWCPGRLAL